MIGNTLCIRSCRRLRDRRTAAQEQVAAPQFGGGNRVGEGIKGEQYAFTELHQPSSAANAAAFSNAGITMSVPKSGVHFPCQDAGTAQLRHVALGESIRQPQRRRLDLHPQATSPNRPFRQPAQLHALQSAADYRYPHSTTAPQETSRPQDHTLSLFPVGLGLGVVPARVISAAQPLSLRRSDLPASPSPKKSVYRSSPRLRCSTHARYSPGKAGSSQSSPSCLTTAAAAPALILDIGSLEAHPQGATGRHDGRHHVRSSLEPHRQTFEAIHIQRGRYQPIFHNQPHRGNGQQFVRAALFKRVPGCGWERRFVRHIAHGPDLTQRFTRHIENRESAKSSADSLRP